MAGIPNRRRRRLIGGMALVGAIYGLGFSTPAYAESTTLWCEGTLKNGGTATVATEPWSGSIDIDYGVGTISMKELNIPKVASAITDQEIRFKSSNWGNSDSHFGVINRLSGTVFVQRIYTTKMVTIDARCRPATQKF